MLGFAAPCHAFGELELNKRGREGRGGGDGTGEGQEGVPRIVGHMLGGGSEGFVLTTDFIEVVVIVRRATQGRGGAPWW